MTVEIGTDFLYNVDGGIMTTDDVIYSSLSFPAINAGD